MSYTIHKDKENQGTEQTQWEGILILPPELFIEIFLFLKAPSRDLVNCMLACKEFHDAMNKNYYMWKEFAQRKFPWLSNKEYNLKGQSGAQFWKSVFKNYIITTTNNKMIGCSDYHTVFLVELENGTKQAFGCGNNAKGQLGHDEKVKIIYKPQQITGFPDGSNILNCSCSSYHTIFLVELKDGIKQIFGCRNNKDSQLGIKTSSSVKTVQKLYDINSLSGNCYDADDSKDCHLTM